MKLFAIGDLHLGFEVDKPMNVFGEHWEAHISRLEAAWKKQITEEDIVLIPGDISWAMRLQEADKDLRWLQALPGHKICIRGNHDYWWSKIKKLNATYSGITFLQNNAYCIGSIGICGTRGWFPPQVNSFDSEDERLYKRELERLTLSLEDAMRQGAKELWVMLHYPPTYHQEMSSPCQQLLKNYPVSRVIYGHLHDPASWQEAKQGMEDEILYQLVSADYLGFTPLYLKRIEDRARNIKMESRE